MCPKHSADRTMLSLELELGWAVSDSWARQPGLNARVLKQPAIRRGTTFEAVSTNMLGCNSAGLWLMQPSVPDDQLDEFAAPIAEDANHPSIFRTLHQCVD